MNLHAVFELCVKAHVILGFAGLVLFWIPIFAKKGGPTHIRCGRLFVWCAYGVVSLALFSCAYRLVNPLAGARPELADDARVALVAHIRGMYIFLGYLGIMTFAFVRQAVRVIQTRHDPDALRTPFHAAVALASIGGSVTIVVIALTTETPFRMLFLALSPIGLIAGGGILAFMRNPRPTPMAWWYEHMGAILGAGISFHTAFAAFGAGRLFGIQPSGALGILPWILPTAIGVPASWIWTRYYRRKFGELPVRSNQSTPLNTAV